jgi:hypothetical protein
MPGNNEIRSVSTKTSDLVGKAGPITGSALSMIGAVITLFGFVLPWASCGASDYSGLDIVNASMSGELANSGGAWLILIPSLALIVLGLAISNIPIALLKKVPTVFKPATAIFLFVVSSIACCPSMLFLREIQSARYDPNSLGMGGMIRIEYGFWVSLMGILLSIFGGLTAIVTSVAHLVISRKSQTVHPDK